MRLALFEEVLAEQRRRSGERGEVRMGRDDVERLVAQPEEVPAVVDVQIEDRAVENGVIAIREKPAGDEHPFFQLDGRQAGDVVDRHRAGGDPRPETDDAGRLDRSRVEQHREVPQHPLREHVFVVVGRGGAPADGDELPLGGFKRGDRLVVSLGVGHQRVVVDDPRDRDVPGVIEVDPRLEVDPGPQKAAIPGGREQENRDEHDDPAPRGQGPRRFDTSRLGKERAEGQKDRHDDQELQRDLGADGGKEHESGEKRAENRSGGVPGVDASDARPGARARCRGETHDDREGPAEGERRRKDPEERQDQLGRRHPLVGHAEIADQT